MSYYVRRDRITLSDVSHLARALYAPLSRSWQVGVRSRTRGHRINEDSVWMYTEAEVWRDVDQDYGGGQSILVGTVIRDEAGLAVQLTEGLDWSTTRWIIGLCKERKVRVVLPASVLAVMKELG